MTIVAATAGRGAAPAWPASLVVAAALALGLFATWPTATQLLKFWSETVDYEHGIGIAAVSLGWLVLRRREFDAHTVKPRPLAAAALLVALLLWLVGLRGISQLSCQMLLPPVLWLAVWAAAGDAAARRAAGPLAFLYFAVPFWDYLLPALRSMTVTASEFGLGVLGVPAKVVGDSVTIPEGTFDIVEGCSGKRYFLVSLAFAGLLGTRSRLPLRRHLVLFAAAAAAALLANWIRVIVIIYAGHVTQMQHYWVSVEHLTMGTVIFGILLLIVLLLARALAPAASAGAPAVSERPLPAMPLPRSTWLAPALLAAMGVVVLVAPSMPKAGPARLTAVPLLTGRFNGPLPPDAAWRPSFPGAVDEVRVAYRADARKVEVYVNLFTDEAPGRKLVYYENSILTPSEWRLQDGPRWWAPLAGVSGAQPLALTAGAGSARRWAVAYGYVVGGRLTANALLAQLLLGALSFGGPVGAGVVGVAVECAGDCTAADRLAAGFWEEEGAQFARLIPRRPPRATNSGQTS